MKRFLSILIIIVCLWSTITSQACFGPNSRDFLQTGTVNINTNMGRNRQSFFQTQISYQIPNSGFQTALSISSFSSYNSSQGLNFLIRGGRIQTSNFLGISVVSLQNRIWQNVQVSYFVSSRNDVWAGSFTSNLVFFNQGNANTIVNTTVSNSISDWVPDSNPRSNYNVYVFISSLVTSIEGVRINLGNTAFDKIKGKIATSLINTSIKIQLLTLSYIVFSDLFTNSYSLNLNLPQVNGYTFKWNTQILSGRIDINRNNVLNIKSNSLNCFGQCSSSCISINDCQRNTQNIIFNNTCYICPLNTKFDQKRLICSSITCTANQERIGQVCECKFGFIRVGSECVNRCKINQVFTAQNKCQCIPRHATINGQCRLCPSGSQANLDKTTCICQKGFRFDVNTLKCDPIICPSGFVSNLLLNECTSICKTNEIFNTVSNSCVCRQNFYKINQVCSQCPSNQCVSCRLNEVSLNVFCECRTGTTLPNQLCTVCPAGLVFNSTALFCQPACGINQVLNGGRCICAPTFNRINRACGKCPIDTFYDQSLLQCTSLRPSCPPRSSFDSRRLTCVCNVNGENLINNVCQVCGPNSGWNGSQCVCISQFFLVESQCSRCPDNTFYNSRSRSCICNRGFYQDTKICRRCDASCGSCSGPTSKNCLDCVDVSFKLVGSECIKSTPCVSGQFLKDRTCTDCSSFCTSCVNQNKCSVCLQGFNLVKQAISSNTDIQFCDEICGDGKRFFLQCDDGNNINGDGCNSQCSVQSGWTCSAGSTTQKSVCILGKTNALIIKRGAVIDISRVLQGVTILTLPSAITDRGCPNCAQILKVSVIKAQVIPQVKIEYIPTSQYKYLVEFFFNGLLAIPPFVFTLRINEKYERFFTKEQMSQVITVTIDPALLSRVQKETQLTIDQIQLEGNKIEISQNNINNLFKS